MSSYYWIPHPAHRSPSWSGNLRQELIAAFRRGSMNAERCLRTYRLHGEPSILPAEAVIYLATRVVAGPPAAEPSWERYNGAVTSEFLQAEGQPELAGLAAVGRDAFEGLVEAGRRFFFPGPLGACRLHAPCP
jgi:hypothetical protein